MDIRKVPRASIQLPPGVGLPRIDADSASRLTASQRPPVIATEGDDGDLIAIGGLEWLALAEARQEPAVTVAVLPDMEEDDAMSMLALEGADDPLSDAAAVRDGRSTDGWGRLRTRRAQILARAEPVVIEAVGAGDLSLAAARQIARIDKALQQRISERVVEHGVSLAQLRSQVTERAVPLSDAPFDASGCQGCPSNGAFDPDDDLPAACHNSACWREKKAAAAREALESAKQSYPVVVTDIERDPATYRRLVVEGGVGEAAYQSKCSTCPRRGVVLRTRLGNAISDEMCFDLACNNALTEANGGAAPNPGEPPAAECQHMPREAGIKRIEEMFAQQARRVASDSTHMRLACAAVALQEATGKSRAYDRPTTLAKLSALTTPEIGELIRNAAVALAAGEGCDKSAEVSATLLDVVDHDFTGALRVDGEFLKSFTKPGIENELASSGFRDQMDGETAEDKAKALRKLMGQKVGDIIEHVEASQHDWSSYVPPAVYVQLRRKSAKGN